jgi:hypothetical protein
MPSGTIPLQFYPVSYYFYFSCLNPLAARVYTKKKRSCCSVRVKCLYVVARLILLILF